ncbi:MAG: hypothetical protein Q7S22_07275 [Candidatus Micrarchaeota archaeon]|nr:hypothetical protein [Candidatus Micrarchaeota archaeon]
MTTKDEILKNGFLEVRIRVTGIFQRHKFTVVYDTTPLGKVVYLQIKNNIIPTELAKLASEYQLPFRSPLGTAYPAGKGSKDFVQP